MQKKAICDALWEENMQYQYIPHIWLLIVSGLFSLSLGIFALLKRREAKGAISFVLSMLAVTFWSLPNAFEMSATDLSTKLFWANVQYIAYCFSPLTLLALCMEFTGYDSWIKSKKILWLAVLPAIITLLVWTDGLHGLIRYNLHMDYSGIFPVIAKKYGPAFYIHALYSHGLNIAAFVLLINAVFFKNTVYRKQAIVLLFGVSLIVMPNVIYVLGLSPLGFDITPVFIGPAGFIMIWGIFRYKMFDLVPLARATVIETMDAGVMVLDLQNRVLDMNPAFQKIIKFSVPQLSNRRVENVCVKIPELIEACNDRSIVHTEFIVGTKDFSNIYEALLSPLTDSKGVLIGRLVVTYDITKKKQTQQVFLMQQWKLAAIEERERMARDLHDNLGQVLGFINLQAQGIRQELINAGVETVSDKLDKLVEATQIAHSDIREYIRVGRTSMNSEQEFVTSIKTFIKNFENQTGLGVKLDLPSEITGDELKPMIYINILNIIKEALNNVRKHSEAKNVKIIFSLTKKQLCATVEDDGKGFDTLLIHGKNKTRFGLDIMRERAKEIGGSISIKSELGEGSQIFLSVPIEEGEKQNANESDAG